jgi:CheY-like chemotaxis protein
MDVLLVEDEPLVRASAAEALRDAGLDVAEAACAEEALAAADGAADGPPRVLVADLHLGPGMDGLSLGALALRRWPQVSVVSPPGTRRRSTAAPSARANATSSSPSPPRRCCAPCAA